LSITNVNSSSKSLENSPSVPRDSTDSISQTSALANAIFSNRLSVDLEKELSKLKLPSQEISISENSSASQLIAQSKQKLESPALSTPSDPKVVRAILQLDPKEEILNEYPCFYFTKTSREMVTGKIFITSKHFLFLDETNLNFNQSFKLDGYLDKIGNINWRRRWCVLHQDGLKCYESAKFKESYFPKSSISAEEMESVYSVNSTYDDKRFLFRIRSNVTDKLLLFSADNMLQLNQWVSAIKYVMAMKERQVKISHDSINRIEKEQGAIILHGEDDQLYFGSVPDEAFTEIQAVWKVALKVYGDDPFKEHVIDDSIHRRFNSIFKLPDDKLIEYFRCALFSKSMIPGHLYITDHRLCFHANLFSKTMSVIPFKDIKSIKKVHVLFIIPNALSITTNSNQEITFSSLLNRDAAYDIIMKAWTKEKNATPIRRLTPEALVISEPDIFVAKPPKSMHITILTIGSRGDIQPFISLALGLQKAGHQIRICTHETFSKFVTDYGIDFFPIGGDPRDLMDLCVRNGMFTATFVKEALAKFRGFIDELFNNALIGCQGTEAIIAAPSVMSAYHVAEKLQVPLFGAFTMPFTRTRTYPHPFANPETPLGGIYNYMTHLLIIRILATSQRTNQCMERKTWSSTHRTKWWTIMDRKKSSIFVLL